MPIWHSVAAPWGEGLSDSFSIFNIHQAYMVHWNEHPKVRVSFKNARSLVGAKNDTLATSFQKLVELKIF